MRSIKKGDKVQVIAGSYKGSVSVVDEVVGDKVKVKGVNVRKKAMKGQGFVDKTLPVHISNVMLYSDKHQKTFRVGFVNKDNGKKFRVSKIDGEEFI